jgi:hypothetical protein
MLHDSRNSAKKESEVEEDDDSGISLPERVGDGSRIGLATSESVKSVDEKHEDLLKSEDKEKTNEISNQIQKQKETERCDEVNVEEKPPLKNTKGDWGWGESDAGLLSERQGREDSKNEDKEWGELDPVRLPDDSKTHQNITQIESDTHKDITEMIDEEKKERVPVKNTKKVSILI